VIDAVIQKLRALQGRGMITRAHCIRAECYVKHHRKLFDVTNVTVAQVTNLALDCAALPDEFAALAVAVASLEGG